MRTNLQVVADQYAASTRENVAGVLAEVSPDVMWIEMAESSCAGHLRVQPKDRQGDAGAEDQRT